MTARSVDRIDALDAFLADHLTPYDRGVSFSRNARPDSPEYAPQRAA
jgi:hypothetical protein